MVGARMSITSMREAILVLAVVFAVTLTTTAPVAATGLTESTDTSAIDSSLEDDSSVTESDTNETATESNDTNTSANGTESDGTESDSTDSSSDSSSNDDDSDDASFDGSENDSNTGVTTENGSGGTAENVESRGDTGDATFAHLDAGIEGFDMTVLGTVSGTLTRESDSTVAVSGEEATETATTVSGTLDDIEWANGGSTDLLGTDDLLAGTDGIIASGDTILPIVSQTGDGAGDLGDVEATDDGPSSTPVEAFPLAGPDLPGSDVPTSGVVFGLGTLAAVGAARSGLLPALSTNLGATLTAVIAPVAAHGSGRFDRLVRLLAPLRYSRYDDSDPLEHEARKEVFEIVDDRPGVYLSEIADRASLPLSTTRHHVRVLEREDIVSGAKVRGKRRFYPANSSRVELTAAMNDEATAVVLDAIARHGAVSVSDLANELERDPSTISHHLQRLADDDIIVRERDGRAVVNRLTQEAQAVLRPEATVEKRPVEGAVVGGD